MRRRRRQTKKRRKNPKRFADRPVSYFVEALICLALVSPLAYGFYRYLHESDHFRVKATPVGGARLLSDEAVIAQSGLTDGDNLFSVDVEEVRKRVEAMPCVKSCRVRRFFPDEVSISVVERVALATVLVNGRPYVIDEECVVMREVEPGENHVGPFITNVPGLSRVSIGKGLPHPELAEALGVWGAFSKISMARDVTLSEISVSQANQIRMYCDELNYEIRWKRADFAGQAWKLDVLWRSLNGQIACNDYLDLRFGNDVACK